MGRRRQEANYDTGEVESVVHVTVRQEYFDMK